MFSEIVPKLRLRKNEKQDGEAILLFFINLGRDEMNKVQISKLLSFALRHKPEELGITLDKNGWASVATLIEQIKKKVPNFSEIDLVEIVDTNNKKRFAFSEDKKSIRANQGHSAEMDVDLELKPQEPPEILFHGTASRFIDSIKESGLDSRSRKHVHLSSNKETAFSVGKRHGSPVILKIQAKKMHLANYSFYQSQNGVWLTEKVPLEFIDFN